MSQTDLATAVDVTRRPIDAIERYDPSLEPAFVLTAYFDCRIEDDFDPQG